MDFFNIILFVLLALPLGGLSTCAHSTTTTYLITTVCPTPISKTGPVSSGLFNNKHLVHVTSTTYTTTTITLKCSKSSGADCSCAVTTQGPEVEESLLVVNKLVASTGVETGPEITVTTFITSTSTFVITPELGGSTNLLSLSSASGMCPVTYSIPTQGISPVSMNDTNVASGNFSGFGTALSNASTFLSTSSPVFSIHASSSTANSTDSLLTLTHLTAVNISVSTVTISEGVKPSSADSSATVTTTSTYYPTLLEPTGHSNAGVCPKPLRVFTWLAIVSTVFQRGLVDAQTEVTTITSTYATTITKTLVYLTTRVTTIDTTIGSATFVPTSSSSVPSSGAAGGPKPPTLGTGDYVAVLVAVSLSVTIIIALAVL